MKKTMIRTFIIALFAMMLMAPAASAKVGMKGDLGVGGHLIIGGTAGDYTSGAAFGISPFVTISPIDNLSIWGRLPFWEGHFPDVHVFPFVFGARYYFDFLVENLRIYPSLGIGGSVIYADFGGVTIGGVSVGGSSTTGGFSIEFGGGVEYEVMDNLAIDGSLDFFIPKVTSGASVRIGIMAGVIYYFPVF